MKFSSRHWAPVGSLILAVMAAGCGSERAPRTDPIVFTARADAAVAGPDSAMAPPAAAACHPASTAEPLPAHVQVTSAEAMVAGRGRTVFFSDLFGLFRNQCGACHVDAGQGNFRITEATFPTKFEQKILDVMKSDDPAKFMPPPVVFGKPFSKRDASDPVVELVTLLELWVKNGKTTNPFTIAPEKTEAPSAGGRYLVTPEIGAGLTNLGNCIPTPTLVGSATAKMDELDAMFAKATLLPERLDATDFVALDSETLAQHGVISFAPNYPLWSDSAGKMRYVRVPRGKSIVFDKTTQQFTIPDHTRFYKTFLKKVIDRDGNEAFRKIETRLIVARRDKKNPDDTADVQALYGSYVWNDEETEAILQRQPLHDGTPFTDLTITYVTDEPRVQAIKDSNPASLSYALNEGNPGVLRRYAVPGSGRCKECHMGDASFVLGFTPLQVRRRALGQSGTFEPTGEDELTQFKRLIDYGVISGLSSEDEVFKLEDTQGKRRPRTPEELTAQAYMLGNCAGCHNPRGFPTVKNKELGELLNFLPSADGGGIFEFPLDRMSPRIKRGPNLDESIPYITPSLRDLPRNPVDFAYSKNPEAWKPKWFRCTDEADCKSIGRIEFIDAPWRSLIYRNVDTPFGYSDDFAIFPHMPRNTPGFDCRAPRFMAEWMVSVPSKLKQPVPMASEDSLPGQDEKGTLLNPPGVPPDMNAQPYLEVKADDPSYKTAQAEAARRLAIYRAGRRANYCPDSVDIVDARVKGDVLTPPDKPITNKDSKVFMYEENVPDWPHWVVTDLTEPAADWTPRRFDWEKVLLPAKDKLLTSFQKGDHPDAVAYRSVLESLDTVRITDGLRKAVLAEEPYGLWQPKPGCESRLGGARKLASFTGTERRRWMDKAKAPPESLVYTSSPGAAVFNMICISCHGPQADSRGLQAETLADLTGGNARVANLRDGMLGVSQGGARNIDRVFGPYAGLYPKGSPGGQLVTADDWAGRYVAWMALGGTEKVIPQAILNNVGAGRVLGHVRERFVSAGSPNMLQTARTLCAHAIPHSGVNGAAPIDMNGFVGPSGVAPFDWGGETALVDDNGDADMWIKLCRLDNPQIVRVVVEGAEWDPTAVRKLYLRAGSSYYWGDGYPKDADVMNQNGVVEKGIKAENHFAVCALKPSDPERLAVADKYFQSYPVGGPAGARMPYCPEALFALDQQGQQKWKLRVTASDSGDMFPDVDAWAGRGAINAGLAVMLYLQQVHATKQPTPRFDQCQELPVQSK